MEKGREDPQVLLTVSLLNPGDGTPRPARAMGTQSTHLVVREGCSLPWMWIVLSSCMLRRRVAGRLELGRCVVFLLRREQQVVVRPGWLDREGLRVEG